MQLTVTVDTTAVAEEAGKDVTAVDHWLSSTSGGIDGLVVSALATEARDRDDIPAAAPPPDPVDPAVTGGVDLASLSSEQLRALADAAAAREAAGGQS